MRMDQRLSRLFALRGVCAKALILHYSLFVGAVFAADPLVLKPISEAHRNKDAPVIIGGELADPNDYPASFQAGSSPQDMCTWFLVSARVLLTAAHCVQSVTSIKIDVFGGDKNRATNHEAKSYIADCEAAPGYVADPSQDWGLCLLRVPYKFPSSLKSPVIGFEVINTDAARLKRNLAIRISGFGCIAPGQPVEKSYRVGNAIIDSLPPDTLVPGSLVPTPNIIELSQDPAALCGGDSGGPAFLQTDPGSKYFREVIGVNSSAINQFGLGISFIASTSTDSAVAWFIKWSTDHCQSICGLKNDAIGRTACLGVNNDAIGCRPTH